MDSHKTARLEFYFRLLETVWFRSLGEHPIREPRDTLLKGNGWGKSKSLLDKFQIGVAVTNVSDPVFTRDLDGARGLVRGFQQVCNLSNCRRNARTNVEGYSIRKIGVHA